MAEDMVMCDYCGKQVRRKEATYIEGRPYCIECYEEAEIHTDLEHFEDYDDDEDEDDDDEDDDDEDDDDDDD